MVLEGEPCLYQLVPELSSGAVLCIDDNQDVLECERAFLETFGYTVLTAPSGSKGLELASIHSVDVAIVDYFMPEMNGQEFAIEKAGSLFADYPGVVALRLPNLGLWGGADLGSDHLARHYQLDASILLTAFRGTI